MILLGGAAFSWFEKELGFLDSLWWTIVTVTTVGYGDISPASLGGRIVGVGVMILGIGLLGVFTATVASVFVEHKIKEDKGMNTRKASQHFIICGWNFRGPKIVAELRADPKSKKGPIILIAELPEKPLDDSDLHFIRGEVESETLEKANMAQAQGVIVLSDESLDAYSRDAKTILNTLTVKSLYPSVYACVELMQSKNIDHCQRAMADEIIVVGELSTNLLVQAALDHGITKLITELVSTRYGSDLYKVKVPQSMVGRTFYDIMCELKKNHGALCLAVENVNGERLLSNPDCEYKLSPDDYLVLIASSRPELA
ncbi:MAG: NAD-binding protein [Deltaproteobacteria bacterium]|nr:NAD-binding protein [Deltaproteobacteria bacterium]